MIEITKDLAIISDGRCFTVGKPIYKQSGEVFIQKPRYYSDVRQALRGALSIAVCNGVAAGTITELRQLVEEQERLTAQLKELLAPLEVEP